MGACWGGAEGLAHTPGEEDDEQGGEGEFGSHLSQREGMETSHAVWLQHYIDFIPKSTFNFCLFSLKSSAFISDFMAEKYVPPGNSKLV